MRNRNYAPYTKRDDLLSLVYGIQVTTKPYELKTVLENFKTIKVNVHKALGFCTVRVKDKKHYIRIKRT